MQNSQNNPTKRKTLPLLLLLLLCATLLLAACDMIVLQAPTPSPSPSPAASPEPDYPYVYAADLARYLADNETVREMYIHTMLNVCGKVLRIEQVADDTMLIVLEGFVTNVHCTINIFDYPKQVERLVHDKNLIGHLMEFSGFCNGLEDDHVRMDGCYITKWPIFPHHLYNGSIFTPRM